MDGPDLTVKHFSGLTLPNPFVIGSGTALCAAHMVYRNAALAVKGKEL